MRRVYACRWRDWFRWLGEIASGSTRVKATAGLVVVVLMPKVTSDVDIASRALPFGLAPAALLPWLMQSPQQGLLLGVTNLDERRLASDCYKLSELAR